MRRLHLISVLLGAGLAFAACGGDDGPSSGPPPATTSSTGTGTGTGGDGGMGQGGDGGMGQGGMGNGGMGQGGMGEGGQGMIGGGGSQGACLSCSAFFDACGQGTCPPKSEVCQDSFMILSSVVGCLCNTCLGECEATCTGVGTDMATCNTCIQSTATASCQAEWATCQSDT